MSKTLIRWKLNEVMARHRVKGKDLADFLGISNNAVSSLRKAEIMPAIGGDRWEQICDGINQLSLSGDTIAPFDLIEHIPSIGYTNGAGSETLPVSSSQ
jgi:putative transcriptional regulator